MDLFQVFHSGDIILILTFILLIFMSIYSWYLVIIKIIEFKIENKRLTNFLKTNPLESSDVIISKITKNFADFLKNKNEVNLSVLSKKLDNQVSTYYNNLKAKTDFFATAASSAPFIGLFGTVWGIYNALNDISKNGNASLEIVAGPVGEALVATAFGLFVAIPAAIFYNYLSARAELMADLKKKHIEDNIFDKTLES